MATTDFIVAIELGSSRITGIAGKKNSDGSIQILACAKEESSLFIRKGVIYNLDKTAQSLTSIINKLEGSLHSVIAKVYVGISGQSLRTVGNAIARDLEKETIISRELIDSINDENREIPLVSADKTEMDILDVAPQEYKVGNNLQVDPVGVAANHVEGRFLNIVARSSLKKNLLKCFEQAGIEIADIFISPLVMADVVLNESEKRSGCALVDIGADTTTVSVYKNNILRYLSVIPLGARNITRDLTSLEVEEEEAEKLKLQYGDATPREEEKDREAFIHTEDGRTIREELFNEVVEARAQEIVANIWNQIQLSGYEDKLLSGIVLSGGGANLKNLEQLLRSHSKIEKVKQVKTPRISVDALYPEHLVKDGTQNTILGILNAGKENCCRPEAPKNVETVMPNTLFDEDEALKQSYEQERLAKEEQKKREEEKRKKKEEEKRRKKEQPNRIKGFFEKLTNDIFSDDEMK